MWVLLSLKDAQNSLLCLCYCSQFSSWVNSHIFVGTCTNIIPRLLIVFISQMLIIKDQPLGFEHSNKNVVCRLNKVSMISTKLLKLGLRSCPTHLINLDSNTVGVTNHYLQGIILIAQGTHQVEITKLISQLHTEFPLKHLGRPKYFPGLEVHKLNER